ncbi:MAG TPA: GGDEF domain-containing protein [Thermoleophilaceae bacterium]|nr:GGDEF domain-containing protein [Thermoleophilaceae bacterium]
MRGERRVEALDELKFGRGHVQAALRARRKDRTDASPRERERRIRARALGWLFVAGGLIGTVSMVLPHSPDASEAGLWSNIGVALAVGVALLASGSRVPDWALHATLVGGVLLIARAVYLSGEEVSFYSVWFIWVGLYSFYFFSRLAAALHVGFAAVVYALTLVDEPSMSPVARWLTTMATLVVAGVFIDTLVRRAHRQAESAEESAAGMAAVAEVSHQLSRLSDSVAARSELCEAAREISGALSAVLWEPAPDGASLTVIGSAGVEPDQRALPFVGQSAGAARAFTTGEPVSAVGAEAVRAATPESRGVGLLPSSCLWQPVLRDHQPVAVLGLYFGTKVEPAKRSLRTVTELLAAEAAVTLQRGELLERMEAMVRTDNLTGLPNRRAWEDQLPREMARALRDSRELTVAMLDLDRFKAFNDEFGRQAGDRLLKQAAGAWSGVLRATDLLARRGGEKFVLALSSTSPQADTGIIERLREVTPEGVTCSAGLVRWDGRESAEDLLGRADAALHAAKRAGRDRIVSL